MAHAMRKFDDTCPIKAAALASNPSLTPARSRSAAPETHPAAHARAGRHGADLRRAQCAAAAQGRARGGAGHRARARNDRVGEPLVPAPAQVFRAVRQCLLHRLRHVDGVQRAVRRPLRHGGHVIEAVARIENGLRCALDLLVQAQLAHALAQLARQVADAAQQSVMRVALCVGAHVGRPLSAASRDLSGRWDQWFADPIELEQARGLVMDTRGYLQQVSERASAISSQLMEIMMAQDFQDLTGQVIKKMMEVVNEVETQLLQVLIDNSPMEKRAELAVVQASGWMNGPQIKADNPEAVTARRRWMTCWRAWGSSVSRSAKALARNFPANIKLTCYYQSMLATTSSNSISRCMPECFSSLVKMNTSSSTKL
jgi:chemotaxis regulatin CheY-phosphate phosphatase CheZ